MSDPARQSQNLAFTSSFWRFIRARARRWTTERTTENPGAPTSQEPESAPLVVTAPGLEVEPEAVSGLVTEWVPGFGTAMSPDKNFDQIDWRLLSENRAAAMAALGYRLPVALRSDVATPGDGQNSAAPASRIPATSLVSREPGATSLGIVTISTCGYLAYARTLFESVRCVHPEAELYLCLADAPADFATDLPGVRIIPAASLGFPTLPFLALKYSATELCCALKPLVLRYLVAERPLARYIYIDSDMCVYARLDALLAGLNRADFVVTPHMTAPFPSSWDGRVKPTQGDLLYAGLLNAGVFAFRPGNAASSFLETWATLVTQPGAFMPAFGGQCEQHAFNWILAFVDRVCILKDPATNVGYWNLHDRSVRWQGFDGGSGWTVNGQPLVCFHFSGYSPDQPFRLSKHEGRHLVHLMPSIERLLADYRERLRVNGWRSGHTQAYPYARFPSGIPIDDRMRDIFKEIELWLESGIDPWTVAGEEYYAQALFSSLPETGSLMPVLLQRVYRDRVDLQQGYPRCELEPRPMLDWFHDHGLNELPPHYRVLYDKYRAVVPDPDVVLQLRKALEEAIPVQDIRKPFTLGRPRVMARLTDSRHRQLRHDLHHYKGERYFTSVMRLLWQIYESRPDLRHMFPDVLGADAERCAEWLLTFGHDELMVPAAVPETLVRCAGGRSMARIFSYMNRTHWLMERWPLALIGRDREEFARVLLTLVRDDLEFDVEDVITYLWTMHVDPYSGLPLALELVHNLAAAPSSRLPEGQEVLLAGPLADPRCREALDRYRLRFSGVEHEEERNYIRTVTRVAIDVSEHLTTIATRPQANGFADGGRAYDSAAPEGANVFGFFKSPIGLGEMSRGTSSALRAAGFDVAENVVGNVAMDADLRPEDFERRFDHQLPVNVFVSYPHLNSLLLRSYPRWMTQGRTNIVHLAWEQRDSAPHWQEVFSEFDQVWALSSFAARSLERQLGRPVHVVHCVLDAGTLPPPLPKRHFDLREDAFTFLYALDANSSLERKNPEAVISAFERAFPDGEDVELCLKISNSHRREHRTRVQRILSRCQSDPRIRVLRSQVGRRAMLQLTGAVDCCVSLHRAEGFGYTCAEAMAYGRPVIATRYSGNLDYMTDDNSWLVNAREIEVEAAEGPFQRGSVWADVDLDHAAACMREVYERPAAAARRAARGRDDVRRLLSPQTVGVSIRSAIASPSGAVIEPAF